ncbi:MAG: putative acylesterase/phospholipase RssA/CRP-like cAMP-binding protein [Kiritimatiellia bacterium]|jgi:predicted acylesterase/phospholipase RssA/CRP-like cAMP-binding protein
MPIPCTLSQQTLQSLVARHSSPAIHAEILAGHAYLYRAGEALFLEGDESANACLLVSGLLQVLEGDAEAHRRAWITTGAWVGEMGVLTGDRRTATVRAWRDSVVLSFGKRQTSDLLTQGPDGIAGLVRLLIGRGGRQRIARSGPWVLGLLTDDDVSSLAAQVRAVTSDMDRVSVWEGADQDGVDAVLALESRGSGSTMSVLIAKADDGPWCRMVARSADRCALAIAADLGASRWRQSVRDVDVLLAVDEIGAEVTGSRTGAFILRRDHDEDLRAYFAFVLDSYARPERLADFRLFRALDPAALAMVREQLTWRTFSGGEQVVAKDDVADELLLLQSGRLQVSVPDGEGIQVLAQLQAGDSVGENSLVAGGTRIADVHALRDSRVASLSRQAFGRLRKTVPEMDRQVAHVLAEQTSRADGFGLRSQPTNLAVVSLDKSSRCQGFAQELLDGLTEQGLSAFRVDEAAIETQFGRGASGLTRDQPGHTLLLDWLHRLERAHDVLLYVCSGAAAPWSKRCLRQADHVLWVAEAHTEPALRQLEASDAMRGGYHPPADLVLLQASGIVEASGTAAWLDLRPDVGVHHVREDTASDLAAAIRRTLGCAVGLVLAGASTRAPAHWGTYRAMGDLRIPCDIVAGTSSGAAIAAGVSLGFDNDRGQAAGMRMAEGSNMKLWEMQPPYTSLSSGKGLNEMLRALGGDRQMEDQIIPCHLSAVDIAGHRLVWLKRGPMWKMTRASMSLPFIWPPVTHDGMMLVDGGLMSYMPIEAALPFCQRGLIVASDIVDPGLFRPFEGVADYGTKLSGWRQFIERNIPWVKKQVWPELGDVLFHAMGIPSFQTRARFDAHPAVLYVRSPFEGYGLFDVDAKTAAMMEEVTYDRAMTVLQRHLDTERS